MSLPINFQACTENEASFVKEFCKSDKKALGYPFEKLIQGFIKTGAWWASVGNKKAGFISFSYKKKRPNNEIRIENLYVLPEFRNNKIALHLINFLYENTFVNNTTKICFNSNTTNFVAECWDGFPNNSFYDKISSNYQLVERKTFNNLRRYFIDINKVKLLLGE